MSSLTFRISGAFLWPPTWESPDAPAHDAERRLGSVEIHQFEQDGKYRTALRWTPEGREVDTPSFPTANIHDQVRPLQLFENNDAVYVWIDSPGSIKPKLALGFHGAFLFEQFAVAGAPEMQLPLLTRVVDAGHVYFSSLLIGQNTKGPKLNSNFRFNLKLPTPIGPKAGYTGSFPVSLIYPSQPSIVGRGVPEVVCVGNRSRQVKNTLKAPFGTYGFSWYKGASQDFLHLNKNLKDTTNYTALFTELWPQGSWRGNTAVFREQVLQPLKLDLAPGLNLDLPTPGATDSDESVLHLDFAADDSKVIRTIKYRLGAKNTKNDTPWKLTIPPQLGRQLELNPSVYRKGSGPDHQGYPYVIADLTLSLSEVQDSSRYEYRKWKLGRTVKLRWVEDLNSEAAGLPAALSAMTKVREANFHTQPAQPQSTFMGVNLASQVCRFATSTVSEKMTGVDLGLTDATFTPSERSGSAFPITLEADKLAPDQKHSPVFQVAQPPSLVSPLPRGATLRVKLEGSRQESAVGKFLSAFKLILEVSALTDYAALLGGLAFKGKVVDGTTLGGGELFVGGEASLTKSPTGSAFSGREITVAVQLKDFTFDFQAVEPLGLGPARRGSEPAASPILVTLSDPDKSAAHYRLRVTESVGPYDDHTLSAQIRDLTSASAKSRDYVVISAEPFSIFRFTQTPLAARGDAGGTEVANYSSLERLWRYKAVTDTYRFTFPPQAVGESMDKPGRLELHDVPTGSDDSVRPFESDARDLKRRAVEFRLTPPCDVWIRPSDVARGYFLPEWEAFELFRQRGELGLGVALAAFRGEFLYGLAVGVETSKERGLGRRARVAEIEALLGRPLGVGEGTVRGWPNLARAIRRRPERLELWADNPDSVMDFAPARFSEGVSFALRETALHRAPIDSGEAGRISQYPLGPKQTKADPDSNPGPRYHPQGLSGGALWPIEATALFQALLTNPKPSGGTLESVALSPIGGDADQRAEFLNGQVAIISETRNGFIQKQRVEVVGRIAPFWHRAKHVVVYERTCNHSAQFCPTDGPGSRTRRPVLRKVREYIELLQTERLFPDFDTASPQSSGFLKRVRFNTRVINVDSSWSRDVGTDAWEVPLWNRHDARQRPQVYPRPDIAFCLQSEGEGERPEVVQECLDPDYIYFYAFFEQGQDREELNTDRWPVRPGVDFAPLPDAQKIIGVASKLHDKPSKRQAPVSRFLPGSRRFTWRLAPAAQKVILNAARSSKPIYVSLDTVSFMRGYRAEEPKNWESMLKLGVSLPQDFATPPLWNLEDQTTERESYRKALTNLQTANDKDQFNEALDAFTQVLRESSAKLFEQAKTTVEKLKGRTIPEVVQELTIPRCAQLKAEAVTTLKNKSLLVGLQLKEWEAEALAKLDSWTVDDGLAKAITDAVKEKLTPIFETASRDVGGVQQSVEKARAIISDYKEDGLASIRRAQARVRELAASYDSTKPWSPEREQAFLEALEFSISSGKSELLAAVDEARYRLGVELDGLAQGVVTPLSTGIQAVALAQGKALADLAQAGSLATNTFMGFRNAVSVAKSDLDTFEALLTQEALKLPPGALRTILVESSTNLNELSSLLDTLSGALQAAEMVEYKVFHTASSVTNALSAALIESFSKAGQAAQKLTDMLKELEKSGAVSLKETIESKSTKLLHKLTFATDFGRQTLPRIGTPIDLLVETLLSYLEVISWRLAAEVAFVGQGIDGMFGKIHDILTVAVDELQPISLLEKVVIGEVLGPIVRESLKSLPADPVQAKEALRKVIPSWSDRIVAQLKQVTEQSLDSIQDLTATCDKLEGGLKQTHEYLSALAKDGAAYIESKLSPIVAQLEALKHAATSLEEAKNKLHQLDAGIRDLHNTAVTSVERAKTYGTRLFEATTQLAAGGLRATPNNILKIYAAVTSAPELGALKSDIDRMRATFDDVNDVIQTTKCNALLNRMGDELKAMGLTIPFDQLSDRVVPALPKNVKLQEIFQNFGGVNLDRLLPGVELPDSIGDRLKITHDFDKKQAKAWLQVDIDVPIPDDVEFFSAGPFLAQLVRPQFQGQLRLEASKDTDQVSNTGHGRISTALDLQVSGGSLVRFEDFGLAFNQESGLKVEFDPKKIRVHNAMRFVQEYLAELFPEEVGGLAILKQDGIPVGLMHEFALPPVTVNFGTSGVSNISIGNRFSLIAFPNFVLRNTFNLSRKERPFIFSIFILGGSGYIELDVEYQPIKGELAVSAEFAAGASAALAFAAGPFSGQVFIAFSAGVAYRKAIGGESELLVSVSLVVAGYVDVAGIVSCHINLVLQMTYRDNGQIDAEGRVSVSIRISRFFRLKASANARYKLRGGRTERQISGNAGGEVRTGAQTSEEREVDQALDRLKKARR